MVFLKKEGKHNQSQEDMGRDWDIVIHSDDEFVKHFDIL
jgi:hypothetical protein